MSTTKIKDLVQAVRVMDLMEIGWMNHQSQVLLYKPFPSQLIAQQEMDKDSNATPGLMIDDVTLKTFSPASWESKVKKLVLDGCGKWIMASVQDTIFCSINFTAMK
jgi:hypothetical protein